MIGVEFGRDDLDASRQYNLRLRFARNASACARYINGYCHCHNIVTQISFIEIIAIRLICSPCGVVVAGASFQLFWGAIFLYFSMPQDYWKIGRKQHFIFVNLTLFIVPFFLFFIFSFFFFSLGRPPIPSPSNDAPGWWLVFNDITRDMTIWHNSRSG